MNPLVAKSSFPVQIYLASCVHEVARGTKERPGHTVVDMPAKTMEVDVAAAQACSSDFTQWLVQHVPAAALHSFNVIDVGAAIGDPALAYEVRAVADALGVWNAPTVADTGVEGATTVRTSVAGRVLAVARGDRLPRVATSQQMSEGGLGLGGTG